MVQYGGEEFMFNNDQQLDLLRKQPHVWGSQVGVT